MEIRARDTMQEFLYGTAQHGPISVLLALALLADGW